MKKPNTSAAFRNAHAQAKAMYATGLYASYRGAFSLALSIEMKRAWAQFKLEQVLVKKENQISFEFEQPKAKVKTVAFKRKKNSSRFWGEQVKQDASETIYH